MESKTFTGEPLTGLWLQDDFDKLLCWIHENGYSDISFGSGLPIYAQLGKFWRSISRRKTSADEGFMLINALSRNPGMAAQVQGGVDKNFTYEVKNSSGTRLRFRVSATAIKDGYGIGINIIMRSIASTPPLLSDLDVDPELAKHLFPENGLVIFTGVMGTGKSTTLAAVMRQIVEDGGRMVLTYESPIEFDYMTLKNINGPIYQSEIPIHLEDFSAGVNNAMRRAANVAMLGEARDKKELHAMNEMASRGVATYSTLHTKSVYDAPSRILSSFPHEERFAEAASLNDSLRLIVQQRLFPRKDDPDKRVVAREWVAFDEDDRQILKRARIEELTEIVKEMTLSRKSDLLAATQRLYDKGLISDETLLNVELERTKRELVPS